MFTHTEATCRSFGPAHNFSMALRWYPLQEGGIDSSGDGVRTAQRGRNVDIRGRRTERLIDDIVCAGDQLA